MVHVEQYHPLGMVFVWDVVANSDALYMLTQPRTVDTETNLLRFDMARGTLMSVRLPFSGSCSLPCLVSSSSGSRSLIISRLAMCTGGKLELTPDHKYLLAAGPSNNSTLCESPSFTGGCTLAYTLDPIYLRQLSVYLEGEGGCAVHAVSSSSSGQLYLASADGATCTSYSFTGYLTSNGSWELLTRETRLSICSAGVKYLN
jgi:hypothetical protein